MRAASREESWGARVRHAQLAGVRRDSQSDRSTKATRLRFVAARLGVAMEETVAIGDSWNDAPMLERPGSASRWVGAGRAARECATRSSPTSRTTASPRRSTGTFCVEIGHDPKRREEERGRAAAAVLDPFRLRAGAGRRRRGRGGVVARILVRRASR